MDPLSIALAVITIATAIKDLVELAQRVKDSVSQVARNNKEALVLSEEMVETILELKIFCNDYHDILENSTHMKSALVKLTREMQASYKRISAMLPESTGKTFRQMKVKIQAWMRRNMLQDEIRELRDRVSRCYLRFTTFAVMRIEGQLKQTNSTQAIRTRRTSTPRDQVQHRSVVLEQGVVQLRLPDQRLAAFVGSAATTHPHSSLELTENFVSDIYVHCQVGRIDKLLTDLPIIKFSSMDNPSGRYARVFEVNGIVGVWDPSTNRDAVVKQTLEIQHILRKGHTLMTVEEATWELDRLSCRLRSLGMDGDSAMTSRWIVHLLRTLVNTNSEVYMPYLVQALLDLSNSYMATNDLDNAAVSIFESQRLIQPLLTIGAGERELTILHCRVLTALGRLSSKRGDKAGALPLFEEAVGRFEILLCPYFATTNAVCKPLDTSWEQQRRFLALRDYSYSLHCLSFIFKVMARPVESVLPAKKAAAVIQLIMTKYPASAVQKRLAQLLFQLSDPVLRQVVTLQDAHQYSKGSVTFYRTFYNQDPRLYDIRLYNSLWRFATILQQMDYKADALSVRQEMADLARRITHDKTLLARALNALSSNLLLLQRYDEAVTLWAESIRTARSIYKTVSIQEADGHYNISLALQRSGRPKDALPEVEEAVTQYRALAFGNPGRYLPDLARGLEQLSDVLDDAGDHSQAFNAGHESLKNFESVISSRPDMVTYYVVSLTTNVHIARNLRHPTKSIERCEAVIRQFRQLALQYPTEVGHKLADAMCTYSALLDDFDMLQESTDWCKQSLELHESHTTNDGDNLKGHMNCLIHLNVYLWSQGYFSRALEPLTKAIGIGEEQLSKYPSLISTLVDAKYRRANIFCSLGRYAEAVDEIRSTINLLYVSASSDVEALIRCLIRSSRIHRLNGNFQDAITVAREAVQLCRGQSPSKQLSLSLVMLVEGLVDTGKEDQAAMDEVRSIDLSWKHNIPAMWTHSICLFAKGQFPDEADLLWVKRWYTKRTIMRPGHAPQFAKNLWMLGIFYCAQGRHEECQTVATELKHLVLKIQAYPETAGATERTLEYERNRPSWRAILARLDLSCHH